MLKLFSFYYSTFKILAGNPPAIQTGYALPQIERATIQVLPFTFPPGRVRLQKCLLSFPDGIRPDDSQLHFVGGDRGGGDQSWTTRATVVPSGTLIVSDLSVEIPAAIDSNITVNNLDGFSRLQFHTSTYESNNTSYPAQATVAYDYPDTPTGQWVLAHAYAQQTGELLGPYVMLYNGAVRAIAVTLEKPANNEPMTQPWTLTLTKNGTTVATYTMPVYPTAWVEEIAKTVHEISPPNLAFNTGDTIGISINNQNNVYTYVSMLVEPT